MGPRPDVRRDCVLAGAGTAGRWDPDGLRPPSPAAAGDSRRQEAAAADSRRQEAAAAGDSRRQDQWSSQVMKFTSILYLAGYLMTS
jgi:hypothetical protein